MGRVEGQLLDEVGVRDPAQDVFFSPKLTDVAVVEGDFEREVQLARGGQLCQPGPEALGGRVVGRAELVRWLELLVGALLEAAQDLQVLAQVADQARDRSLGATRLQESLEDL